MSPVMFLSELFMAIDTSLRSSRPLIRRALGIFARATFKMPQYTRSKHDEKIWNFTRTEKVGDQQGVAVARRCAIRTMIRGSVPLWTGLSAIRTCETIKLTNSELTDLKVKCHVCKIEGSLEQ
jgi:hypothetical protein